ncbi:hypothetical protein FPOAC2_13523 [Fusarium poae]
MKTIHAYAVPWHSRVSTVCEADYEAAIAAAKNVGDIAIATSASDKGGLVGMGGWLLLDDDVETVRVTLGSITNIQKKVANNVMKVSKLHLVTGKLGGKDSREKCGHSTSRQWLSLRDGEEYCWYVMRNNPNPTGEGQWHDVGTDIYEKMASYSLGDRETYYRPLIDCALNKGDSDDIDTSNLVQGEIPRCLFNLPAVFVEHDSFPWLRKSFFQLHMCLLQGHSSPVMHL